MSGQPECLASPNASVAQQAGHLASLHSRLRTGKAALAKSFVVRPANYSGGLFADANPQGAICKQAMSQKALATRHQLPELQHRLCAGTLVVAEAHEAIHIFKVIMDPDVQELRKVASVSSAVASMPGKSGSYTHPTWSPDGSCVLLELELSDTDDGSDELMMEEDKVCPAERIQHDGNLEACLKHELQR